MNPTMLTSLILIFYCGVSKAWDFSGNQGGFSFPGSYGPDPSTNLNFDVDFDSRSNLFQFSTGIEHWRENFGAYLRGHIDTAGQWGVGAGLEFRFRKRSAVEDDQFRFNVTVRADPCNFFTYDYDRDGTIAKEEFQGIFGNNERTNALFQDLNMLKDDEVINLAEFYTMAPTIIENCRDLVKDIK